MPQVDGKFYPLQHTEWVRACKELTSSQKDVLYYLRTIDPYSNGFKITAAQIARDLSTPERTVHRQTISRALKELDAKGFINLELIQVQVEITPKGYWCKEDTSTVCEDTAGTSSHHVESPHTTGNAETPQGISTHQPKPKTQSEQASQSSKINKTYSDFKESLTQYEREKLFNFVKEKTSHFNPPLNDVEDYLASKNKAGEYRYVVWQNKYLEANGCVSSTVDFDWLNHPKYEDWKTVATEMPAWFIHEGDKELTKKQRIAFVDFLVSQQQEVA